MPLLADVFRRQALFPVIGLRPVAPQAALGRGGHLAKEEIGNGLGPLPQGGVGEVVQERGEGELPVPRRNRAGEAEIDVFADPVKAGLRIEVGLKGGRQTAIGLADALCKIGRTGLTQGAACSAERICYDRLVDHQAEPFGLVCRIDARTPAAGRCVVARPAIGPVLCGQGEGHRFDGEIGKGPDSGPLIEVGKGPHAAALVPALQSRRIRGTRADFSGLREQEPLDGEIELQAGFGTGHRGDGNPSPGFGGPRQGDKFGGVGADQRVANSALVKCDPVDPAAPVAVAGHLRPDVLAGEPETGRGTAVEIDQRPGLGRRSRHGPTWQCLKLRGLSRQVGQENEFRGGRAQQAHDAAGRPDMPDLAVFQQFGLLVTGLEVPQPDERPVRCGLECAEPRAGSMGGADVPGRAIEGDTRLVVARRPGNDQDVGTGPGDLFQAEPGNAFPFDHAGRDISSCPTRSLQVPGRPRSALPSIWAPTPSSTSMPETRGSDRTCNRRIRAQTWRQMLDHPDKNRIHRFTADGKTIGN